MNQELIEKAKEAKSVEELLAMAKAEGVELTEEQAKEYFAQLNPASGEISDDELDAVAGGGCGKSNTDGNLSRYRAKYPVGTLVGNPDEPCICGNTIFVISTEVTRQPDGDSAWYFCNIRCRSCQFERRKVDPWKYGVLAVQI